MVRPFATPEEHNMYYDSRKDGMQLGLLDTPTISMRFPKGSLAEKHPSEVIIVFVLFCFFSRWKKQVVETGMEPPLFQSKVRYANHL